MHWIMTMVIESECTWFLAQIRLNHDCLYISGTSGEQWIFCMVKSTDILHWISFPEHSDQNVFWEQWALKKFVFCHCPWLIEWIRIPESEPTTILCFEPISCRKMLVMAPQSHWWPCHCVSIFLFCDCFVHSQFPDFRPRFLLEILKCWVAWKWWVFWNVKCLEMMSFSKCEVLRFSKRERLGNAEF